MSRSANIQSVERAFAVLRCIGVNGRATPLGTIAEETGLPKSTVSRLLGTMVGIGAVERVGDGQYSIGSELRAIVLPAVGQADLISIAATYLRALVEEVDEDVGLAIPDGDSIVYIDQVQSPHPVMVQDWTGNRFEMHTTAAGYVALASMDDDELDRYLARPLDGINPATQTDPVVLRKHVASTRQRGYAWTFEVWAQGINGAAAPIRDEKGTVVASVSLFGPAYRFPGDADTEKIGERLVEVADQISRHLGAE